MSLCKYKIFGLLFLRCFPHPTFTSELPYDQAYHSEGAQKHKIALCSQRGATAPVPSSHVTMACLPSTIDYINKMKVCSTIM